MSAVANPTNPRLLPGLRYRDVAAAIDWLCGAFGFKKHDVVTAVDGTILHARLVFGAEMILLLPVRNSDRSVTRPVQEIGNEMQSCYFAVDDADDHYRTAKNAGAEILEITEYEYGGRGYACRDPEGHIWNFVTHDSPRVEDAPPPPPPPEAPSDRRTFVSDLRLRTAAGVKSVGGKVSRRMVVAAAASVAIVTVATAGWMLVPPWQSTPTGEEKSSKLSASLPRTADDAGQQAIERIRLNRRLLSRIHRKEPASESAPQQAGESGGVDSPTLAATAAPQPNDKKELNAGLASQPAATHVPQEVLRQPRAAEQAPAERVLIPSPVRVETPKQAPKPLQEVREQQLARERAAKEYVERARVRTAPAADAALPEANSPFWDCQTGPGGTVNCNPKKGAALEASSPLTPKPKVTAAQPPNAPSARQPHARSPQLWDCKPQPPADEVVCRPIGAAP